MQTEISTTETLVNANTTPTTDNNNVGKKIKEFQDKEKKKADAKNRIDKKVKEFADSKKEKKDSIIKLNLSAFTDKLKHKEIEIKKSKESFYIYPENWNESIINGKEGKNFRSNKRKQLEKFCNQILIFVKYNREVDLLNEIKLFKAFYKLYYKNNNFKIESLTQVKDENKISDLNFMLDIIINIDAQLAKKK